MAFAEHVDKLDAAQHDARGAKGLEPEHGSRAMLGVAVILSDYVVQVLALPNLDLDALVGVVVVLDASSVGAAACQC